MCHGIGVLDIKTIHKPLLENITLWNSWFGSLHYIRACNDQVI